jgi:adenine/guanine phosphoribosyltransferase-like PRPP-binding protein
MYMTDTLRATEYAAKVPQAIALLNQYDFDAFAFRGMSGALLAAPLAFILGKERILCRKQGENNHSGHAVEGYKASKRYIIVDDGIDSGATVSRIICMISVFAPEAKCLGILLWSGLGRGKLREVTPSWFREDEHYNVWGESMGIRERAQEYQRTKQMMEPTKVLPSTAWNPTKGEARQMALPLRSPQM